MKTYITQNDSIYIIYNFKIQTIMDAKISSVDTTPKVQALFNHNKIINKIHKTIMKVKLSIIQDKNSMQLIINR